MFCYFKIFDNVNLLFSFEAKPKKILKPCHKHMHAEAIWWNIYIVPLQDIYSQALSHMMLNAYSNSVSKAMHSKLSDQANAHTWTQPMESH